MLTKNVEDLVESKTSKETKNLETKRKKHIGEKQTLMKKKREFSVDQEDG